MNINFDNINKYRATNTVTPYEAELTIIMLPLLQYGSPSACKEISAMKSVYLYCTMP